MADASGKTAGGEPGRSGEWLGAWQPVTGGGVAAFGRSSFGRLFFFQVLTAIVSALALLWSIQIAWVPVINEALAHLPEQARVRHGRLEWPDQEAITLADSPQLGLSVLPNGANEPNRTADLQVELDSSGIRLWGILGYHEWPYPPAADWNLGRLEATALWAAWRWPLRVLLGLAAGASLLVIWWCLEAIQAPFLWLFGLLCRRDLSFGGAWRIAGASWLTSTLIIDGVLLAYARRILSLTGVAAVLSLGLLAGLLWPLWGVLASRAGTKQPEKLGTVNPFSGGQKPEPKKEASEKPVKDPS